jgi:hypothetical protein
METQREAPDAPLPGASAVQRSPFVASSPAPRESPVVAKHTPPAQPPSANPKAQDGTLSEVLLPSGAIVPAKPPAPAPVNVSAPTDTVLSFLQWSSDPDKRIAFIRVSGGPLMLAHEGDTVGGYTVVEIHQDAVDLRSGEAVMTLRVR